MQPEGEPGQEKHRRQGRHPLPRVGIDDAGHPAREPAQHATAHQVGPDLRRHPTGGPTDRRRHLP